MKISERARTTHALEDFYDLEVARATPFRIACTTLCRKARVRNVYIHHPQESEYMTCNAQSSKRPHTTHHETYVM